MAIQTETETNADGELPADVDDRALQLVECAWQRPSGASSNTAVLLSRQALAGSRIARRAGQRAPGRLQPLFSRPAMDVVVAANSVDRHLMVITICIATS
jgi:hypothetical protein